MIANSWTSSNKLKASKGYRDGEGVRLLEADDKIKVSDSNESDKERSSSNPPGRSSSTQSVLYSRDK